MTLPEVSVVVPCFNQGRFLVAALRSIAASTELSHEVIVIDDGSTDRLTQKELRAVQSQAPHQDLHVITQENAGLAGARNRGLAESQGQWVQFLDADDLLLPGAIDARIDSFQRAALLGFRDSPRAGVIGHYMILEDASGVVSPPTASQPDPRALDFSAVARKWERGLSIPIHCALFRRDQIELDEWFEESLSSKEDWFFWLSLTASGAQFVPHELPVALYRLHGKNMTQRAAVANAVSWLRVCEMARRLWPSAFTDDDVALAHVYWRSYYLPKLWGQFGPEFPWKYFHLVRETPVADPSTSGGTVSHS